MATPNSNNTASIGFEQQIWAAADILRGNMDAAEYKYVVLGLIFLKYISDKFEERYRELEDDISKIAQTFEAFQDGTLEDIKGFCAVVKTEEIAKQDNILTPGRYVGIEEQEDDGEPFKEKMTRFTGELSEMFSRSHKLEDEIRKRLGAIGYEI